MNFQSLILQNTTTIGRKWKLWCLGLFCAHCFRLNWATTIGRSKPFTANVGDVEPPETRTTLWPCLPGRRHEHGKRDLPSWTRLTRKTSWHLLTSSGQPETRTTSSRPQTLAISWPWQERESTSRCLMAIHVEFDLILIWFNGTSAHMGHFSAWFIECFTTTFLRAHSWLNWVDPFQCQNGTYSGKIMVKYSAGCHTCRTQDTNRSMLQIKLWSFKPLLCTLFRLNWAKQMPGIMRRN